MGVKHMSDLSIVLALWTKKCYSLIDSKEMDSVVIRGNIQIKGVSNEDISE
jgi:hypothetical protein